MLEPTAHMVCSSAGPGAAGGTDLMVCAFYDLKVPGIVAIIEPVLTGALRRTFRAAADAFGRTYLVDERP